MLALTLFVKKYYLLEIALRQQQHFVDKIFLIESSFTHKGVRMNIRIRVFLFNLNIYVLVKKTSSLGEAEVDQEV